VVCDDRLVDPLRAIVALCERDGHGFRWAWAAATAHYHAIRKTPATEP
jgi:hypothetical protein